MEEYDDLDYPLLEDEWGGEEEAELVTMHCSCGYFCMDCLGLLWFDFL